LDSEEYKAIHIENLKKKTDTALKGSTSQAVTVASSNTRTPVQRDERLALAQSSASRSAGSEHYRRGAAEIPAGGAGVSVTFNGALCASVIRLVEFPILKTTKLLVKTHSGTLG